LPRDDWSRFAWRLTLLSRIGSMPTSCAIEDVRDRAAGWA
jgi:hypothetical protein